MDLGDEAISTFFANHTCNKYCDSKWIPHDDSRSGKGSSMVLSTKLAEFHLGLSIKRVPIKYPIF
jgi:hypothetical protein